MKTLLSSFVYRGGNQSLERVRNLSKVTLLARGESRLSTQAAQLWDLLVETQHHAASQNMVPMRVERKRTSTRKSELWMEDTEVTVSGQSYVLDCGEGLEVPTSGVDLCPRCGTCWLILPPNQEPQGKWPQSSGSWFWHG